MNKIPKLSIVDRWLQGEDFLAGSDVEVLLETEKKAEPKVSISEIFRLMNFEPALLALPPHVCNKSKGYKKLFPKMEMIVWLGAFLWLFEWKDGETTCAANEEDMHLFCDLLIENKKYSHHLTHPEIMEGFYLMHQSLSETMLEHLRGIDWNTADVPIQIGMSYALMKLYKEGRVCYKRTQGGLYWGLKEWENDPTKMVA